MERAGVLDDRTYATARALSLHRRGASARAIRANLLAKGVPGDLIDEALGALSEEAAEAELAAAVTYARRRRLGPFRDTDARPEARQKDLAALSRAGFSYGVALKVVDAPAGGTPCKFARLYGI